MLVGVIKRQQQLGGEPSHDFGGNLTVLEPVSEAPQRLSHELKDKTHVVSVGALMLEVVDELGNVLVARLGAISITEMFGNLPIENGLAGSEGHVAQYFESAELVLLVRAVTYM